MNPSSNARARRPTPRRCAPAISQWRAGAGRRVPAAVRCWRRRRSARVVEHDALERQRGALEDGDDGVEETRAIGVAAQRRRSPRLRQQSGQLHAQRRLERSQRLCRQLAHAGARHEAYTTRSYAGSRTDGQGRAACRAKSVASELLPMPASPVITAQRLLFRAVVQRRSSARSRPISHGGTLHRGGYRARPVWEQADHGARRHGGLFDRGQQGEACRPTAWRPLRRLSSCSQRSKASSAAARSPRR